ncbi:RNA polymerase sigma factor [Pendulispora albinea]|uniref:Sigma-70 family RNA polymerase sigma factor n=1 Tax=Pendulispora albinea TaxID=2741071 RepID=A0ABZ2LYI9_9BACT
MTEGARSDIAIAAAYGNDEALAVLVRTYHDRVYRFGLRVCRDGYDADDAVQEAFIKLAKRPDVAQDPSALSWLMSVIRNTCRRMLRPFVRQRRSSRLESLDETGAAVSEHANPHEALERWELVRTVHSAIASLDRPYREVLVMRDLEGLTGRETCQALGLDVATMKTRLHRARTRLREELLRHRDGSTDHEPS